MNAKAILESQNPLILRLHRLIDAFAKSDDERDFFLDRVEGFILFIDLDKTEEDLNAFDKEFHTNPERLASIPKLTFYETKKIMESFVHEKVYDIDTKEKLLDVIQSKDARATFLEFIHDHLTELEKWQQFYQERSRVRIIEWLRQQNFHFVFEEDLDLPKPLIEKLKQNLFETKVGKDLVTARKALLTKAKTYYSNEALNPRPKRGRPPKQAQKQEVEALVSTDIFLAIPPSFRPFLFTPDISSSADLSFSSKFGRDASLLGKSLSPFGDVDLNRLSLNDKLKALRALDLDASLNPPKASESWDDDEDDADEEEDFVPKKSAKKEVKKVVPPKAPEKATAVKKILKAEKPSKATPVKKKEPVKKEAPKKAAKEVPDSAPKKKMLLRRTTPKKKPA